MVSVWPASSDEIEPPSLAALSVSWPHCAFGDGTRRSAGSRGLPLAAGRRAHSAQHQRGADTATDRVARRVRRRAVAGRVAPLSRPQRHRPCAPRSPNRITCGRTRCSRPTDRTRCCRPCCSPMPARVAAWRRSSRRTSCTVTSPGSPGQPWSKASARPTSASTSTAAVGLIRETARPSRSCARRTTRLGSSSRPTTSRAVLAAQPGLLVVDEAYGQFAEWSALTMVDESTPLVVTRTFSKTWSMAASRLGYRRRAVVAHRRARQGGAAVSPRRGQADRRSFGAAVHRRDGCSRRADRRRARAQSRRASGALDIDVFPSGANFILFRPRTSRVRQVWQELLDRSILIRDCSGWPRLTDCLRVTVGTPEENDEFLAAMSRDRAMSRAATVHRATKETSIDLSIELDGSGTTEVSTGIPFYDHMLEQVGKHGGFDLHIAADRRPPHRHASHGRRRRDQPRRGVPRGARRQGRRPPIRQRSVPARRGPGRGRRSTCPVGRSSCGRSSCPNACRSATRRSTRSWPSTPLRRSRPPPASRCTSRCAAVATCITSSRQCSRGWRGACATRFGSRAAQVPSTKGVL